VLFCYFVPDTTRDSQIKQNSKTNADVCRRFIYFENSAEVFILVSQRSRKRMNNMTHSTLQAYDLPMSVGTKFDIISKLD
jgi:hypothetical protein